MLNSSSSHDLHIPASATTYNNWKSAKMRPFADSTMMLKDSNFLPGLALDSRYPSRCTSDETRPALLTTTQEPTNFLTSLD